jgi:hypothetical protein
MKKAKGKAGKPMRSNAKVKPGTKVGSMGYKNKSTKTKNKSGYGRKR